MKNKSILICGAGIAGASLAHFLLKRGFEPVLLERAKRFREAGYVIDFWGVGYDVAERMGLLRALRDAGYVYDRVAFVDRNGKARSEFGGEALSRALKNRFLTIQRSDLAHAIYATVEGKAQTIFGDTVRSVDSYPDGVEVTFERAPSRTFDLVIGADGLHSALRAELFGDQPRFERYLGYYVAAFVIHGYPRRTEGTYIAYSAPGRMIGRFALRDQRTGFLFVFARPQKSAALLNDKAAQKRALFETFDSQPWVEWPQIRDQLECTNDFYFDSVSQIHLPAWSKGRCALVGDAAYCPSLLAGQGAAFAMTGAYILTGELEKAGDDYATAFSAYEHRFRPFIERKQKDAQGFAASFAPKSAFGILVRDTVLRMAAIPAIEKMLMQRFVADPFPLPNYPSLVPADGDPARAGKPR